VAEPTELQILLNLQAALQAIAVASGYFHDVTPSAVKLDPDFNVEAFTNANGIRPLVYLQPQPEEWRYVGMPSVLELRWPLKVHWIQSTAADTDQARAEAFYRGCADVERALTQDCTRGGLAIEHRILTRNFNLANDGSTVWAEIETLVVVRRKYGQP